MGVKTDCYAPGLSCRFASERTLHFRWPPSVNVGLDGVIYSDRVSNLLMYLGAESAVSSENPLKSLGIRADFDSTMRRFESSRPSQDLANKIRHFLNLPDFHSERRSLPNSEGLFPMRSPAHGRTAFWSLIGRGANSSWHSPRMIPSSGAPIGRGLGRTRDVDSCDDKRKRRSGWTSSAKIE